MNTRIYLLIIYFGFATIVANAQPAASFTVTPPIFNCERQVYFNANTSTVSSGQNIIKYEWDFDYDGITFDIQASGVMVENHTFFKMGTYTVALRVTDDSYPAETDISTENATLTFTNLSPIANAGGPYYTAFVNGIPAPVIINGEGSIDPNEPCDEIVTYKWDTDGDGLYGGDDHNVAPDNDSDFEGAIISLVGYGWQINTTHTIALKVTDSYGLVSDPDLTSVNVVDINSCPPTINDFKINNVVRGDAQFEFKVSHPKLDPQTFDCAFYINGALVTVSESEHNLLTQIDYAGNNVIQSVVGYFDATAFPDGVDYYQLMAIFTMSNGITISELTYPPFTIDNTPPTNPTSCSEFGTISGNCTNDNDPSFIWSGATDNQSAVLDYYYYWGIDPTGESVVNHITYEGYDPDPLLENGMYYLRINTFDKAGNSAGWETIYVYKYFDYNHSDVISICDGDSLLWHTNYYKTAGTYYDNMVALNGCDSICELTLSLNPVPESFVITGETSVAKDQSEIYLVPENPEVTYVWDVFHGTIIDQISDEAVEIQWDDAISGYIYVVAENIYGCQGDTSILEINIGTTDINVLSGIDMIEIYPNPVEDILSVRYDKDFIIELYDINGSSMLISSDKEINVSNIKQGLYICLIRNKHGQLIKIFKIVKK